VLRSWQVRSTDIFRIQVFLDRQSSAIVALLDHLYFVFCIGGITYENRHFDLYFVSPTTPEAETIEPAFQLPFSFILSLSPLKRR
jgi:hypothetical protein